MLAGGYTLWYKQLDALEISRIWPFKHVTMFILHGIYAAKVSLLEHFFIRPYRVSEVLVFFAKMNFTIHCVLIR